MDLKETPISLWLKAHHEMGPVRLGERFSFALERDDVGGSRLAFLPFSRFRVRAGMSEFEI